MSPLTLLLLYCLAILLASLLGGLLPLFLRLGHTGTQVMMSAVAGFMLGVAVLHMLGHALVDAPDAQATLLWMLGGFLVMFFTERFFAYHHHDLAGDNPHPDAVAGCAHAGPVATHAMILPDRRGLHWLGALAGMSIHSLISGTALAAAVASATFAATEHADVAPAGLAGFAVLLAILGHKPLDALTVVGLARASGLSRSRGHLLNAGFALVEPVGVLAAWWGLAAFVDDHPALLPAALAFSAGTFLCVALSDLLPEVQFHKHDRLKLSAALLLGLSAAWSIGLLETDHAHEHARFDAGATESPDRGSQPVAHDEPTGDPGHAGHAGHAGRGHPPTSTTP